MRWIPRLLAGTCVVVAAALTAAPVTAGLADLVLGPGPQTAKRGAQPALTSQRTPSTPTISRSAESSYRTATSGARSEADDADVIEGTIVDEASTESAAGAATRTESTRTAAAGTALASTELVAATPDAARARVTDLAADLQAGVDAGEFTQADADRVLDDIAGYIHGDRTWPERLSA
ncbi:hypothetical protein [Brevibacterium atlanticum]|uniref:hypothetical protein n=1 Tax=Brevibacterium atlanticum TaxID=2697563 RepID=UPI0014222917|nr:hypothetical protein [Brevibacterium atlanticum]